jgi:hypothetical protein
MVATGCGSGSGSSSGNATTAAAVGSGAAGGVAGPGGAAAPGSPEILGIRWPGAQGGETLRIIGTNFDTAASAVVVEFPGGVDVTATAASAAEIKVSVPYNAASGSITVRSGGQTTNAFAFTMWQLPASVRPDDHGNDAGSATAISLGQRVAASVDALRDNDWFSVDLVGGQPYVIRTVDLSHAMDTVVYLRDPSGAIIGNPSDDYPGYGFGSGIDFTPASSGTYFVQASHFRWSADGGTYEVIVQSAALPAPTSTTNTAPQVETVGGAPTGVQSEAVTIQYRVNDPDADPLAILAFYREWSSSASEYKPATMHVSSEPVVGVDSSSQARVFRYVWDSRADLGAVSGTYQLEFMASDGTTVGRLDDSGTFTLTNPVVAPSGGSNAAPVVMSVGTPSGIQTGAVTIPYRVSDAEGDPVAIRARYMLDAVSGFQSATLHPTSDPVAGVAAGTSGQSYRFVWDSFADLGAGPRPNVIFQIVADDGQASVGRTTGNFQVNN